MRKKRKRMFDSYGIPLHPGMELTLALFYELWKLIVWIFKIIKKFILKALGKE